MRKHRIAYDTTRTLGKKLAFDAFIIVLLLTTIAATLLTVLHVTDYVFGYDKVRPWFNWFYLSFLFWTWLGLGMIKDAWINQYHEQWRKQLRHTGNRYHLANCRTPAKHKLHHITGSECPCPPPERKR